MFHVEHEQLKIQKKCSTGDNVPRGTFFYGILKKEVLYCRKDAKKTLQFTGNPFAKTHVPCEL